MSVALRVELATNLSAVLWVLLAWSFFSKESSKEASKVAFEDGGVFCDGSSGIYNAPL